MANIQFLRGLQTSLNNLQSVIDGALYFTTDTHKVYMGTESGLQEYSAIEVVATLAALPAAADAIEGKFYYAKSENVFCFLFNGEWKQVNPDTGMTSVEMAGTGNAVTTASYDAASRKLTLTKGETFATKGELDALDSYVGDIPSDEKYADISTIVGYINKKAEETLASAQGGSSETATSVKAALDTYKTENDAKVNANTKAISDMKDSETLDSFADVENELAKKVDKVEGKSLISDTEIARLAGMSTGANKVEASTNGKIKIDGVDTVVYTHPAEHAVSEITGLQDMLDGKQAVGDYATKTEAKGYADAKDSAIAAAKKAGDDAAAALETYKGTNDAAVQQAQNTANAKVASVTAGDASMTVAGTATAPTVAVKLDPSADNAIKLGDNGLKVEIAAAPEYSIVKADDSGDFAAIYNLTKDGVVVGASINIPKDMVVKSGSVVDGNIVLVLNDESNTEIVIPASSLIEYVTSGSQTGDMVVVNVSDDHKVTATITDGTITLSKLHVDVQTAIGQAHTHENATVLNGISADDIENWNGAQAAAEATAAAALAGAKSELEGSISSTKSELEGKISAAQSAAESYAGGLDAAMNTRVEALEAIDHTHANKAELDLIASGDKAKWDEAAGKAHTHSFNETELNKIAEGDVAKWNSAQANAEATAASALSAAKTELEGKITAEANTARAAEKANADAIDLVEGRLDVLEAIDHDAYKGYADQAEADAITASKAYTDGLMQWGEF